MLTKIRKKGVMEEVDMKLIFLNIIYKQQEHKAFKMAEPLSLPSFNCILIGACHTTDCPKPSELN